MAAGQLRGLCKCNHCSGAGPDSADVLDPDNSVTDQGTPLKSRHGHGNRRCSLKCMNIQGIIAGRARHAIDQKWRRYFCRTPLFGPHRFADWDKGGECTAQKPPGNNV
jgi:hypothetical protein